MKGKVYHEFCVTQLDHACHARGLETRTNAPSRKGRKTGYVDLLASGIDLAVLLLIEVEMGSNVRTMNDIEKLRDFRRRYPRHAVTLWIVTPTVHVARLIRNRIKRGLGSLPGQVFVLTLFEAIERLYTTNSIKNLFCTAIEGQREQKRTVQKSPQL